MDKIEDANPFPEAFQETYKNLDSFLVGSQFTEDTESIEWSDGDSMRWSNNELMNW